METIVLQHDATLVAEAIRKRGADAIARIDRALQRGALEVQSEAQAIMPVAEGETQKRTVLEHLAPLTWQIAFGTTHAAYTERGTGAGGRPTLVETLAWMKRKSIQPRTPGMSTTSLAFLIRRKIAREGTPAQPFAALALRNKQQRVLALVLEAARGALGVTSA